MKEGGKKEERRKEEGRRKEGRKEGGKQNRNRTEPATLTTGPLQWPKEEKRKNRTTARSLRGAEKGGR